MKTIMFIFGGLALAAWSIFANPVEVGDVAWGRDHDLALQESKKTGKPVFVLFQEVPGCKGCRDFGKTVLTNPDLVNVIETNFVPLLIYNNRGGKDAELLRQYGEPSWNFQVVRFLDGDGRDIIPRRDRIWDIQSLSRRMAEVLAKTDRPIPAELRSLVMHLKSPAPMGQFANFPNTEEKQKTSAETPTAQVAFAQHCFWTGEMIYGGIDGVVSTEAGFLDGREVTLVDYDPKKVSLDRIVQEGRKNRVADKVYVQSQAQAGLAQGVPTGLLTPQYRKASESDQKRQLKGTPVAKLDLTPYQATKVNAWIRRDSGKALNYLTPEQLEAIR
ncbi:MAG: VPGUxxT family thioredoxin-like (seleno)protein, type 2 [Verrucomicrobiota bacterium]